MKTAVQLCCIALLVTAGHSQAQELRSSRFPTEEHAWLQQFVGEWESTSKADMGPDKPPMECTGRIKARSLGGLWVIWELESEMMGTPVRAVQTLGYDPEKKKFIGTWVDSLTNHMWQYEGSLDKTGKELTFEAEGPNFVLAGKTSRFRDTYRFKSKDELVLTSAMLNEDGKWVTFMTGVVKRVLSQQ